MENTLLRSFRTSAFTFNRATFRRATFRSALVALLALAGAFGIAGSVRAQWTEVTVPPANVLSLNFGSEIHCVRFLDNVGAPLDGYVGVTDTIWRTVDGGATWATTTVPGLNLMGAWINDFTFVDSVTGFAVVQGNTSPGGASGILKTTDGGLTWNFDVAAGTPDSGCGIYYNRKFGRLFVAGLDKGLVVSNDKGATWNLVNGPDTSASQTWYTGFAFIDDTKGVVCTQGSNVVTPIYHTWLRTFDGGLTWSRTNTFTSSWQPMGISTTSTYFASTDNYQGFGTSGQILRSDNSGYTFVTIAPDSVTESMAGDGCTIFATTTNVFPSQGMLYSVDEGATWQTSVGAPVPPIDTRFYVSPTKMWSFSGNNLWSELRPATPDIHVWPKIINFLAAGCVAVDTTIHIFACKCANTPVLLFDTIHKISTDTSASYGPASSQQNLLNWQLCPSGDTSFVVTYKPTTAAADTADFHLIFRDGTTFIDDTVQVGGGGVTPGWTQIPGPDVAGKDNVIINEPACIQLDTFVTICNTSCSVIQIVNIAYTGDTCCIIPEAPSLPVTLNPGDCIQLHVYFNGGLVPHTCQIHITVTGRSGNTAIQADFFVYGNTTTTAKPLMRGFNVEYKSCCDAPDSLYIYFENNACDTITLEDNVLGKAVDISPVAPSLSTCFVFDSASVGDALHHITFPHAVGPGDVVTMKIKLATPCVASNCAAIVTFNGSVGTSGGGACNALAQLVNDTVHLNVKIDAGSPTAPTASSTKFNFGGVSCCDTTETRTIILTSTCVPLTFDSIAAFNNGWGHYIIVHQPHDSTVFEKGYVDSIVIRFIPPPCDSTARAVPGGLSIRWKEFPAILQTFQISGASVTSVAVSQSADILDYDTIKFCSGKCDTLTMKNTSCTPGKIFGIAGPKNKSFTLVSPAKGDLIPQDSTLQVVVCLNPETTGATGSLSDQIIFTLSALDGSGQIGDTVDIAAVVTPPTPGFTTTQLAVDTLCDSATITEQFTVTNIGDCYTYDITSATAGTGVNTLPLPLNTPYPVHIAPGASETFSVTFTAGTTDLTGTITLLDSGGNSIPETYNIPVKPCNVPGKFTLTMPGNIIITPNCTNGLLIFTADAGGGSGTVTGVSVTPGSTRFTVTNPSGGPMSLTDTVIFNPNLSGVNNTTLSINYTINGGSVIDTSIPLTGVVSGAKDSAHIGISSPADTCIYPNGTDIKEFDIVLQDTIQDSLGMTQVSFLIHYNGDLLWNPKLVNPGPGWSVGSWYQDTMGIHVTMIYRPTGRGFAAAGDVIVQVNQFGALSKFLSSNAYIDSTHFNDSAYEACTMKALSANGQSVAVCIDTLCYTNIIRSGLQGTLSAIQGIDVIPNPAHKNGVGATLNFTTNLDGVVDADVLDILGNSVLSLSSNNSLAKGDHSLPIPTQNISEGTYFVRIQMSGYTIVKKFILQKE